MRDNDHQLSPKVRRSRSRSRSSSKSSKPSRKSADRSSYSKSLSRSRSRSSSAEIDGFRLHIADVGENVRKSDLEKLFAAHGQLKEIWMTNSTPCFGFAVFKDKKDAASALQACDGVDVAGSRIRVSYAKPRTRGSGRRFFNPNMRCYQCGYSGHFYRDCPDLNGGGGDKRSSRYESHSDRYSSRRRERGGGDRDYHASERDYGRRRTTAATNSSSHRSSRRYDDYGSSRSSRRHRY